MSTDTYAFSGDGLTEIDVARVRRFGWWFQAEKMLRSMRSYTVSIVVSMVGLPLLYLLSMGVGLGALVDRGRGTVDGQPYLVFVAPAILVSTVVQSVLGEMTYPVMGGFKWQRTYLGAAATPLAPGQLAFGHLVAVLIRFFVQAFVFWLLALPFGALPGGWSIAVVPIAVLTAAGFGTPLQAFSATRETGDSFSFIQRFVVMPMFLFAGTFFPLDVLPWFLRWVGWISPVWHGTQLSRAVSYGLREPAWLVVTHVVYLAALAVVGSFLAARFYRRRLVD